MPLALAQSRGELCGLNENDVDFINNRLTIQRARYVESNLKDDETKNITSHRTISIPDSIINDIKLLLAYYDDRKNKLGSNWKNSPALLKSPTGGPIYPQSIYRYFSRIQKKYNLKHITLHGLRHTHISMLISSGELDIKEVSSRAGHSQTSTTMNIYAHLFKNNDDEIGKDLEEKYFKNK